MYVCRQNVEFFDVKFGGYIRRPLGCLKGWEDNIKMDLREVGWGGA
jgi:hypothetical protein